MVPVTEHLYIHQGTRSSPYDVHPPKAKDYTKSQGEVFGHRFVCPAEVYSDETLDPRFVTPFPLDYYNSAILPKSQPVVIQKYIDWDHCASLGDPDMTKALAILERHNFKNLMTMQYPWNNEVIAQFFATVWYEPSTDDDYGIVHFSIQGRPYLVSYPRFARILGFELADIDKPWLNCSPQRDMDISFAYYEFASTSDHYTTNNLRKVYRYINLLVRQTLVPKIGLAIEIHASMGPLLIALKEDVDTPFSAFGFIFKQIQFTSYDPKKSCTHAPYIMKMIEIVTQKEFNKEMRHEAYRPVRIDVMAPKRGRKPR